jgi:hypothetical protein
MNSAVSPALLSELNECFADILTGGLIEQTYQPIEGENGAFVDKPRLVLAFDRRSMGKLRALINRINEAG